METNTIYPRMHVSLYVTDLEKTEQFYTQFFRKEPEKVKSGYAKYILEAPSLIISFIENPERVQANFGHLGFQVATPELMQAYLTYAKEKGMVEKEEIGTSCCYAIQDKFWVQDPDGIQWEVYYFHEDAEFNDPKYSEAEQCCIGGETAPVRVKKKVKLSELTACDASTGCC